MARTGTTSGRGLWQMPLLIVALGVFGYATYRFADPGPGPTFEQKVELARAYLGAEQPDAAMEVLNKVLRSDRPTVEQQGIVRLLIAEVLDRGQQMRDESLPENHAAIVEQLGLARQAKAAFEGVDHRREGDAQRALGKTDEALAAYARAMELDQELSRPLTRLVAQMLLDAGRNDVADATLQRYLKMPGLSADDTAWALGERAELLSGHKDFAGARELLGQVLALPVDDTVRGLTAYRYGVCAFELGDLAEADRQLRLARQLLKVRHSADADAAYLLGQIGLIGQKPDEAMSFFRDVLVSHPDSTAMLPSRVGRGVARVMRGDDDAGIEDLSWATKQMLAKPALRRRNAESTVVALEKAERLLVDRENFRGALEVLGLEKSLLDEPPASFWGRVADAYERRAGQVDVEAKKAETEDERRQLEQDARLLRIRAGDASFAYSIALTLIDNDGYGEALRRAIELYDRAGAVQSVVAALELFAAERPSDPLTPDAILRLGMAHMAAGDFDKAIAAFERNRFRYPGYLAATKSAVPLAQALMAKGTAFFGRAEKVLLSLVEDNLALTPQAEDFRNAVFELGVLYYRLGRHEDAIARFDEVMKRYPDEPRMGQVLFMMADSYRKSALALRQADAPAADTATPGRPVRPQRPMAASEDLSEAEAAQRDRLLRAMDLFDRMIAYYRDRPQSREIEKSQLRLAHFYRADCAFDLGDFEKAIKLYDTAAFRYPDDASSLAAYVQIVNANVALGRPADARSANERARWLLQRMPPSAFSDGSFALSKAYWERWLDWSGRAGMWGAEAGRQ